MGLIRFYLLKYIMANDNREEVYTQTQNLFHTQYLYVLSGRHKMFMSKHFWSLIDYMIIDVKFILHTETYLLKIINAFLIYYLKVPLSLMIFPFPTFVFLLSVVVMSQVHLWMVAVVYKKNHGLIIQCDRGVLAHDRHLGCLMTSLS